MAYPPDKNLQQLLQLLGTAGDEREGLNSALTMILEALEARVCVVERDDEIVAERGLASPRPNGPLEITGPDAPHGEQVELQRGRLSVARARPWSLDDLRTLEAYGAAIDLFGRMHRAQQSERASADRSHRQAVQNMNLLDSLIERQRLLERLTRIQRSISHRAPLQEVLDAICLGAQELFGDEVVGVRLIDPNDRRWMDVRASVGVPDDLLEEVSRTPVGEGAGGRAVSENRLVVVYEYERETNVVQTLARRGLQSAMAAPVHEHGEAMGSLVTATYREGRRYSKAEQEALLAFAEHVSIALIDAKTVAALREAQRVKEMFLAMASHELKTPLTAIMGTLRTFERHAHALSEDMRTTMLAAAIERADQLAHLINRMLVGARAELISETQEISLDEVVERSVKGFRDSRPMTVEATPQTTLMSDARSIQSALGILLENAIAHSPAGTLVELSTSVENGQAYVSVRNQGKLPADVDRNSLFLPFQRGTEAASSGVGLGLYIASRLARSLGGWIDIDSDETFVTFTLRFPIVMPKKMSAPVSG